MNKSIVLLFGLFWSLNVFALSGQAYMDRFNTYQQWSQNLPINPPTEFFDFVKGTTALSNRLREKWLYELARTKNWARFNAYYQPSNDLNLICYEQMAQLSLGHNIEAIQASTPLWLSGQSRPQACNTLDDDLF